MSVPQNGGEGREKKIEGHSQQPAANSGEDEGDLDDAEMKKKYLASVLD